MLRQPEEGRESDRTLAVACIRLFDRIEPNHWKGYTGGRRAIDLRPLATDRDLQAGGPGGLVVALECYPVDPRVRIPGCDIVNMFAKRKCIHC